MANLDFATSYAEIFKQEKQEDGTLLVYGKATDDAIDSDNQICDAGWLNKAMPEWFKTGGNIREQHSNIAAGVAKELDSKADGHYISALVVDAQSIKKVEAGVLKGFSIGIRAPRVVRDNKAANGRIIDGQIVEVSLVDRPANPNAKLMLAKSDGTEVIQVEEMIEQELPKEIDVTTIVETPVEVPAEEAVEKRSYGESAEAETAEGNADTDTAQEELAEAKSAMCKDCSLTEKECKCSGGFVKSDSVDKCLECGCHKVSDDHGRSDVTTAEIVNEKSDEAEVATQEVATEEVAETEVSETEDVSEKSAISDADINSIIEKAVKSATEIVRSEIELLKSANVADKEAINKLESELATANLKAVNGGPKRAAIKKSETMLNDYALMAIEYRNKAANTDDPLLARGFKDLAIDFEAKASTTNN